VSKTLSAAAAILAIPFVLIVHAALAAGRCVDFTGTYGVYGAPHGGKGSATCPGDCSVHD
jgi:hypothetical protein